jgi:gluconolactonase
MRTFYDGFLTEPRLDHPEGVAVHPDGSVWCGGEAGQLFRIDPDGRTAEQVATSGGFILGLAFDPTAERLYACDAARRAVLRLDLATAALDVFAEGADGRPFRNPNALAVDAGGRVYVSDSYPPAEPGPSVFRFGPDGAGEIWYGESSAFANGLALAPDGRALYVAESFLPGVRRIAIGPDGRAVVELPGIVPDGLAFGPDGLLYIACYEPSQVLRLTAAGAVEVVAHDPTAHLLCHPTNLAFRGTTAITANLGRWHLTALDGVADHVALDGGADPAAATSPTS